MEKLKQIVKIIWLAVWSLPEVISAFIVNLITQIFYQQYKARQVSVYYDMLLSIPITLTFILLSATSLIHMGIMKVKYLKDYRATIEAYKNNIVKMANLFKLGYTTGRPPKYKTPLDLETKISDYFDWVQGDFEMRKKIVNEKEVEFKHWIREPENITITGLVLYLGYSDRQSFYDLGNQKKFSCIIKRARAVVENHYENGLNKQSPTGSIFALKNMGWKDQVHQEVTNTNVVLDMNPTNKENK